MSSFYGPVNLGDSISPQWGADVEKLLGAGTPTQAYNYVIWKTSGVYYARNGLTGERTENTDFKGLMNDKILELYGSAGLGTGGSIFLMPAIYYVNGTINMRPAIHVYGGIRGSGMDTDYTVLTTNITAMTDAPIFKFDYPTSGKSYHSGLHQMWLDGANLLTTNPVIDIVCDTQSASDTFLDDLSIIRGKYGIRAYNNHASNRIWNVFIERCFIELCTYNAILMDSPTNQPIFQCRILRNHFYDNNTTGGNGAVEIDGHDTRGGVIAENTFELEQVNSIYMNDEADSWTIANNIIIDGSQKTTNTYSGIKLVGVDHIAINGNISVVRTAANKMKYGYEADNACNYLCCMGNVFVGDTAGASYGTGAQNIGSAATNVDQTV
jgi:hypothetical protein